MKSFRISLGQIQRTKPVQILGKQKKVNTHFVYNLR